MTKILHVYTHTAMGGGETMLLRLLDGLNKNRFLPIMACSQENSRLIKELGVREIRTFLLKTKNLSTENKFFKAVFQLPNFLKLNFQIVRIIKQEKPDVLQAGLFYSALFSIIPAKIYRKPFIWIAQTPSDLLRYRILTKFLIWASDKTILTCKDFIRLAKENGFNTEKLKVIYTGLNLAEFYQKENSRNEIEINGKKIKKPIVAMVGRFDRYQKGHQYFIEAAKIINGKVSNVNFLIIGGTVNAEEEKFKKELEEKVKKLGLSNQIVFTGFYPDLIYLLSNIEVVVIPSLYEAPSAVAMEAMAIKRPVVASNIGGIPEVVVDGETGFLVPPKNPEAIAEKVIFLLKNPQKAKEMGEKGYLRVKENFTQEKLAREYEKIYINLLKEINGGN